MPVSETRPLDALDPALDDRLGRPADALVSASVPSEHHEAHAEATAYLTQTNSKDALRSDDFDLGYALTQVRLTPAGRRLEVLC
ncbi:hypothetical protein SUDANB6_01244 [Streptomyces sp. enrichment culture]